MSKQSERRAGQDRAIAAVITGTPPEGITREDLARQAGCGISRAVQALGLLEHYGAVTRQPSGRYAPAPGADIAAALAAAGADLEAARERSRARLRAAMAEQVLACDIRLLSGEGQ